jgi:hypothetical protein
MLTSFCCCRRPPSSFTITSYAARHFEANVFRCPRRLASLPDLGRLPNAAIHRRCPCADSRLRRIFVCWNFSTFFSSDSSRGGARPRRRDGTLGFDDSLQCHVELVKLQEISTGVQSRLHGDKNTEIYR